MFVDTIQFVSIPIKEVGGGISQPAARNFVTGKTGFVYQDTPETPEMDYSPVFSEPKPTSSPSRRESEYYNDAAFYVGVFNSIAPTILGKLTDRNHEIYKLNQEEQDRIIEGTIPVIKKYEGRGKVDPVTALLFTIVTIMGGKYMFSRPEPKNLHSPPPPSVVTPPPHVEEYHESYAELDPDELEELQNI